MPRRTRLLVALAGLAAALSACGSANDDALRASLTALRTPPATSSTTKTPDVKCADPTREPAAGGPAPVRPWQLSGGSRPGADRRRRSEHPAARLSRTRCIGQRIEGFEIDLLHELSRALFGRPDKIEFRALTTAERISAVQDGTVDIVVDAVTINCNRRSRSTSRPSTRRPSQRVLVPSTSNARSSGGPARQARLRDRGLDLDRRAEQVPRRHPPPPSPSAPTASSPSSAARSTRSRATTRSSWASRRRIRTRSCRPARSSRRALRDGDQQAPHPDFVRFVNGVLARMRADGTWRRIYRKWLPGPPARSPAASRGTATDTTLDDIDTRPRGAARRGRPDRRELCSSSSSTRRSRAARTGCPRGRERARWSQASAALLALWRRHELLRRRARARRRRCAARARGCPPIAWPSSRSCCGGGRSSSRPAACHASGGRSSGPRGVPTGARRGAADPDGRRVRRGQRDARRARRPWDDLTPRLAAAGTALREATEPFAGAGPTHWPAPRAATPSSARGSRGTRWPCARRGGGARGVAGGDRRRGRATRRAARGRRRRLATARALQRTVEQAREEALSAHEAALAKILAPDVTEPPDAPGSRMDSRRSGA